MELKKEPIDLHRLSPWIEVVGTVEEVVDEWIRLKANHTIYVARDELSRWICKLRKGSRVGILVLDDGSIRVRELGDV